MLFHHFITLVLYSGSYLMNFLGWGLVVILPLDFSDVFVHFCKAFGDTNFRKIANCFGFLMWLGWFVGRIYVYDRVIYDGWFVAPVDKIVGWHESYMYNVMGWFLTMLSVLNFWWFYLISRIIMKVITGKNAEDDHNLIEVTTTKDNEFKKQIN